MVHEEWRDIPGLEGRYQASSLGSIRSILSGRILRPTRHRDGYGKLKVSDATGRVRTYHPHTLVALAFLGPRPAGNVIDHINGDNEHHAPENLRYITPSENNRNRKAMGESARHSGTPNVYIHALGGFYARVYIRGRKTRLGRFSTIEEAKEAVLLHNTMVAVKFGVNNERKDEPCEN